MTYGITAVLAVAGLFTAGCDQEAERRSETPAPIAAEPRSRIERADPPKSDSAVQSPAFPGTLAPTRRPQGGVPVAILRALRQASRPGFDRVVLEFDAGRLPGYVVEYVDGPVYQCGSGDPVTVAGSARLVVRLEPTQAHDEQGQVTVRDRERAVDLPVLAELELICDFEAQVEWVLGLRARTPYRVLELADPPRLVIDLRHP